VQVQMVPGWLVVLLVGREFAVSGLRSIAAAEGFTISASELGKTKTAAQVLAISLLMISIRHREVMVWANIALGIVVFFSVWSAISYFARFWRKIDISVKQRRRRELLVAERQRRRALLADRRAATRARKQAAKADRPGDSELREQPADLPPST
ncbi:MAG TPA: CDP-alcohol phosphatidyltransferase family protein, partial [Bryobacteraceae bacterium]|nr:CDP-alcohol phosphatidyltransferase family protein [Bryobacteraceae bacterium]